MVSVHTTRIEPLPDRTAETAEACSFGSVTKRGAIRSRKRTERSSLDCRGCSTCCSIILRRVVAERMRNCGSRGMLIAKKEDDEKMAMMDERG